MPKNSLARQNEAYVLCEDVQSLAKNTSTNKITCYVPGIWVLSILYHNCKE
jgi:hypothetical protein